MPLKGVGARYGESVSKSKFLMSISFIPKSPQLQDCDHVEYGSPVCLHPQRNPDLKKKLTAEVNLLKEWLIDYFYQKKKDNHITHLIPPPEQGARTHLLFTDVNHSFQKLDFGYFNYCIIANPKVKEVSLYQSIMTLSFSKVDIVKKADKRGNEIEYKVQLPIFSEWAEAYKKINKTLIQKGIWVFIKDEPLNPMFNSRKIVLTWKDLGVYLSSETLRFITVQLKSKKLNIELGGFYYLKKGHLLGAI